MSKSNVHFTKDNEYYTPKEFVAMFGEFDYDPATTAEKAAEFGIANFDTIETDGLTQDWSGYERIWINPPFSRKHEFLAKAWKTYLEARNEIYMLFPIEFLTTARFHNLCGGGEIFIPNGRIKYESGLGKKGSSPAFGSVVMKLSDSWQLVPIEISGMIKPTEQEVKG